MKKIYPYIFPGIALFLVLLLAFRWYNLKTKRDKISSFKEGVEIENLSEQEVESVLKGVADMKTIDMISPTGEHTGTIRYEFKDGKVYFSVNADFLKLEEGYYQVWLSSIDGTAYKKAFSLEMTKSGYMGSAAILEENLPIEVIVSEEVNYLDEVIEKTLLKGILDKE